MRYRDRYCYRTTRGAIEVAQTGGTLRPKCVLNGKASQPPKPLEFRHRRHSRYFCCAKRPFRISGPRVLSSDCTLSFSENVLFGWGKNGK